MRHLAVKNKIVDTKAETKNINNDSTSKGNDGPLCPKPRRLGLPLPPEFLNHSFHCKKHRELSCDGRGGILNILSEKRMDGEESNSRCQSLGACEWSGSPPGRTDNPLVHDTHFLNSNSISHSHGNFSSIYTN